MSTVDEIRVDRPTRGVADRIAKATKRRTAGFVYFVECEGFVKIGYSETPRWRPHDFATGNPFECRLIGLVEGGSDCEKDLHRRFKKHHHRGEWFWLTQDVRAEIDELCGDWKHLAPDLRTSYEAALDELKNIPIKF